MWKLIEVIGRERRLGQAVESMMVPATCVVSCVLELIGVSLASSPTDHSIIGKVGDVVRLWIETRHTTHPNSHSRIHIHLQPSSRRP